MRTIVHLSDLHFNRVNSFVIGPLIETVREIKPDLVAVSGDLTQRARSAQFKEARRFLDALPRPQIVVPGNHDVPMYNFFARFFRPLAKYRRYITDELEPFYSDAEIAVLGINTARSLTIKQGRINEEQMANVRGRLCAYGDEITKIIVTHHPFDLPPGYDEGELVGRARRAMEALAVCHADVLLAGHLHISHTVQTGKRYRIAGYSALVVSAGTATSNRHRGERNSFNVLYIEHPYIQMTRLTWQPEHSGFICSQSEDFVHTPKGWVGAEELALENQTEHKFQDSNDKHD